jgi:hypothetical protein
MFRVHTLTVLTLSLLIFVMAGCKTQPEPAAVCTPDGGLACKGNTIQLCQNGELVSVGACPGGCDDTSGVVRCKANNGAALSPVGAVCREGLTLCGIGTDSPSLLTCRDGRMNQVATCPSGCIDEGETGGLFCLGPKGSLRFHAGFQCPGFQKGAAEYACGSDEKSLLQCVDGKLAPAENRECASCYQAQATGAVTCKNDVGSLIDLETGQVLPELKELDKPEQDGSESTEPSSKPTPPPGPLTGNVPKAN